MPTTLPHPALNTSPSQERLLNALTIDVEDYYHVSGFEKIVSRDDWESYPSRIEASTDRILQILDDHGVHGTFFILGWIADRYPQLVRAIHTAGHEIGCHSYWHRLVYSQTREEFQEDLKRSCRSLEDVIGRAVICYRAPSFSITRRTPWAIEVLIDEGIRIDSSLYPTHHDRYGMPGIPLGPHRIELPNGGLWEMPPPVWRCLGYPLPIGGGGYFRLYPYSLTRLGLRRINASGRPFAVYLHPWEVDPEQPRFKAGFARSFRHYVGLAKTAARLHCLLNDFAFGTLSQALDAYRETDLTRRAA
jgi:polysaccharide deacetylase family protein (PEP-CTERM system associated)